MNHRPCLALAGLLLSCHPTPTRLQQALAGIERAQGLHQSQGGTLTTTADVQGPQTAFVTQVTADFHGHVRIALGRSLQGGIGRDTAWQCDSASDVVALDSITTTVVRGHELHLLALAPLTILHAPRLLPDTLWGGDSAFAIDFRDDLEAQVSLFARVTDSLPLGFRITNHTGQGPREVQVYLDDWQPLHHLMLFRHALFVHGDNHFDYRYSRITAGDTADVSFTPSCRSLH